MSVNQVNQTTGALSPIAGGTLYADAPVGSIQAYGGATAPWGWLICNGAAISRTTYAELFGVIGTSFGAGDGSTTFNVPDLRGEFLRGAGTNSHSGQGSGGSVGQHQDATQIPDIYLAAGGSTIVTPGSDSLFTNTDAAVSQSSGYKQINVGTGSTTNIPKTFAVRPTNTSVNYIIKATTISLPSDFESAVDAKLALKQDKLTNPLTKSDVINNLTTTTTNVPLSAAQGKVLNDNLTGLISKSWSANSGFSYVRIGKMVIFRLRSIMPTLTQSDSVRWTGTQAGIVPSAVTPKSAFTTTGMFTYLGLNGSISLTFNTNLSVTFEVVTTNNANPYNNWYECVGMYEIN